ncbi:hypothetical protein L6R50_22305 [Myxococcota bacterium]|nr:hypothetical protein [Myxococcota bacterium]
MNRTRIATVANFLFPGSGYLILGEKSPLGVLWLAGVIGLTYVELSLKPLNPDLYWTMFASVFVMNIAFAADAHRLGRAQERR